MTKCGLLKRKVSMEKIYSTTYQSPLGKMYLLATKEKLLGIWLVKQKYFLGKYAMKPVIYFKNPILVAALSWLDAYFAGDNPPIFQALAWQGSSFANMVWQDLVEIEYGTTCSYQQLAQKVAVKLAKNQMSPQAIGNAVSHNPFLIIVPCHRVIKANQELGGYAAGIKNKQWLLEHEKKTKSKI